MTTDKTIPFDAARRRAVTRPTRQEAEEAVRTLIRWAGDDPARSREPSSATPGSLSGRDQAPMPAGAGGCRREPINALEIPAPARGVNRGALAVLRSG